MHTGFGKTYHVYIPAITYATNRRECSGKLTAASKYTGDHATAGDGLRHRLRTSYNIWRPDIDVSLTTQGG